MINLISINIDEAEDDGPPSGQIFLEVNGKKAIVTVHVCGELDFESIGSLTDDDQDEISNFIHNDPRVQAAFPGDMYD
jgi:hypothetical protein